MPRGRGGIWRRRSGGWLLTSGTIRIGSQAVLGAESEAFRASRCWVAVWHGPQGRLSRAYMDGADTDVSAAY